MSIELPLLPYSLDALEPYISKETLEYHYGKHHKAYVDNLNALIQNTEFEHKDLEYIIKNSNSSIFNNAAQVYNHNFYWNCLQPNSSNIASDPKNNSISSLLLTNIEKTFGDFNAFKDKFSQAAFSNFGSGWTWLIKHRDSLQLEIINTSNANTPITNPQFQPLLTCDVWEHAYYIDYRNARAKYIEYFWYLVNWNFVANNFNHAN